MFYFTIEESCKTKPWPQCDLGKYFMKKWEKYNEKIDERVPRLFLGTKEAWLAEISKRKLKAQVTTKAQKQCI